MENKIDGRDALLFVSSVNSKGKHDATGAFIPEAKGFAEYFGVPDSNVIMLNCTHKMTRKKRRQDVSVELARRKGAGLRMVAFFGHGWPNGIQFGFLRRDVPALATMIAECGTDDVKVGLFACLTAENDVRDKDHKRPGPGTDGGFADLLRDELARLGVSKGWVDAHKTAGHTTWNPYLIRFHCADVDDPEYGAVGGSWVVAPRSKYWKRWCSALRENRGNLRFGFVLEEELHIMMRLDDSWMKHASDLIP